MNIGIIGFGLIGKQRAQDIKRMPQHRLVAVYDIDLELARKYQQEFDYDIAESAEKLILRKDVAVVIVAVPHHLAVKLVVAALNAGKHVLCEKPMGRNVKEAQSILAAAAGNGVLLEPGFNYRFYPGIQQAAQLLQDKAIGEVTHLRSVLGHGGRPGMEKEWKVAKELCGGGVLLDPGIHLIDLFRFLFGEIAMGSLWAKKSFWNLDVEDNAFVLLRTISDQAIYAHFSITEWKSLLRIEIFGTEGYLILEGRSKSYGPQSVRMGKRWFWLDSSQEQRWNFPAEDHSFYEELKCFLEKIDGKEIPSLATPADGFRALEIVDKLYRTEGQQVKL